MEFETERLILRPVEDRDAVFLFPLINDKEVADNMLNVPFPYPEKELGTWIAVCREAMEKCERFEFAVHLKEIGSPIGVCSLLHIDWRARSTELAYWLGKKYWRQGYMTEAVKILIDNTYEKFGLDYIFGCCFSHNVASARVMRKAGLKYVSHTREAVQKGNQHLDAIYFEIDLIQHAARK